MFDKAKQKITKKFKSMYKDTLETLSQESVEMILKKDLGGFAFRNRKLIKKYYDTLFKNYIRSVKYLKSDFKIRKLDDFPIKDEIHNCEAHYNKFGGKKTVFEKITVTGGKPLMGTLERLRAINLLLVEYPKVLKLLEKNCKCDNYKKINITEEKELLNQASVLKNNDIDLLLKQVKSDMND